jgi:hypothetical protein
VLLKDLLQRRRIAKVDLLEMIFRVIGEVGEGFGIARVSEFIEVDDFAVLLLDEQANEIGADETGSSGDEYFHKTFGLIDND